MTEPDHATIQLLADEGYLVLFLNNADEELDNLEEEYEDFKGVFTLVDRLVEWDCTAQGIYFWHDLDMKSEQFYDF